MGELQPIHAAVKRIRTKILWIRGVGGTLRAAFYLTIVAAAVMAFQKLIGVGVNWIHVGGALGVVALLAGVVAARVPRLSMLAAAGEIDARAGWKERISSLLALPAIQDPMERALLDDVRNRVNGAEFSHLFPFSPPREARWIPVAALAILGAFFLPRIEASADNPDDPAKAEEQKRVAAAVEKLKKQADDRKDIDKKMEKAFAAGERIERLSNEMENGSPSRRDMIEKITTEREKIMEDKKEFDDARSMAEKLQESLDGKKGETGELGEMIREGQFKEAAEEIARLRQKLNEGSLTEAEKAELTKNLQALADKLNESPNSESLSEFEKSMADALDGLESGNEENMEALQEMLDGLSSDLTENEMLDGMLQDLEGLADELAEGESSCPFCGEKQGEGG